MAQSIRVLLALAAVIAASLAGCGSGGAESSTDGAEPPATSTAGGSDVAKVGSPCGRKPPGTASYQHVVWVWLENTDYDDVIGSAEMPYLNALASRCGLATDYHAIAHPSLPNYIAATSGLEGPAALDRYGSSCDPEPGCTTRARSIFHQAPSWKAYQESMPGPCWREDAEAYAVRHNPPPYFTTLKGCAANDVPFRRLRRDLAERKLPAFSFVTPNLCNDGHNCSLDVVDEWLAAKVPPILRSPDYARRKTALFITWDEGDGDQPDYCPTSGGTGCQIATVVISPTTRAGTESARRFDHYSLLRTAEDLLDLPPLGAAREAPSMTRAFGLG